MQNNRITNDFALERLVAQFGDDIISSQTPFELLTVEVKPEAAHKIVKWLKEDEILKVSFLTNIAGIHYPENAGRELVVVYQLHSLQNNFRIRLKAYLPIEKPVISTITDIYAGANWMERETFDFYGIDFLNHPNLIRILNEESMDYFPLRKEYQLEDATRQDKDNRFFGR
jgi:NADH-quinone oxidoreductase subunit C